MIFSLSVTKYVQFSVKYSRHRLNSFITVPSVRSIYSISIKLLLTILTTFKHNVNCRICVAYRTTSSLFYFNTIQHIYKGIAWQMYVILGFSFLGGVAVTIATETVSHWTFDYQMISFSCRKELALLNKNHMQNPVYNTEIYFFVILPYLLSMLWNSSIPKSKYI